MKHLVVWGLAVGCFLQLSEARAARTDMSGSLPGSSCRKVGSAGVLSYFVNGFVANHSPTETLTIDCPIPGGGDGPFLAQMTFVDASPGTLSCTFRSEDAATDLVTTRTLLSPFNDAGWHTLATGNHLPQFEHGQVHLTCSIPPATSVGLSGIQGYIAETGQFSADGKHRRGYHTFPGSKCAKMNGTATGTAFIAGDGSLGNSASSSSGAALLVDCPSITVDAQTGTSKSNSAVWYADPSPSAVSCTMRAEMELSNLFNERSLTSPFNDAVYHSFEFSGANAISLSPNGVVHTFCSLPPKNTSGKASYVVGYGLAMVEEVNDAGGLVQPLKRYPGGHCDVRSGTVVTDLEGAIVNLAVGVSAVVACPILQWQTGPASSTNPGNFKINYVDNSATSPIVCRYVADAFGPSTESAQVTVSSTGDSNAHAAMSFTGIPELRPGVAQLFCNIPGRDSAAEPGSRILSYEGF